MAGIATYYDDQEVIRRGLRSGLELARLDALRQAQVDIAATAGRHIDGVSFAGIGGKLDHGGVVGERLGIADGGDDGDEYLAALRGAGVGDVHVHRHPGVFSADAVEADSRIPLQALCPDRPH